MAKYIKISWLFMALALAGLAACGGGVPASPTVDVNMVYTQMWQTVQAAQTETALAVPTITNTPENTPTLEPTHTPLISDTPQPGTPSDTPATANTPAANTPASGGTGGQSCDNYVFVDDVTFKDGAVVTAGTSFIKTWSVKNSGPCSWTTAYHLIFGWGGDKTTWNTVAPVAFPKTILPGETMEISVTLTAPTAAGQYAAAFRLQNDKGFNFGNTLTVLITVK